MNNRLFIFLLILMFGSSCVKEKVSHSHAESEFNKSSQSISPNEVRMWISSNQGISADKSVNSVNSTSDILKKLSFNLDSMSSLKSGEANVLATRVNGNIRKNGVSYGYRKLVFFKDTAGRIHLRLYAIVPDIKYQLNKGGKISNKFTGDILIFNERSELIGGSKIVNDLRVAVIRPISQEQYIAPKKLASNITVCSVSSGVEVSAGDNGMYEAYYYQYTTCTTLVVADQMERVPDVMGNGGGGGLTGYPPPAPPLTPVVSFDNTLKIDPKKYMDCFSSINDEGSKFEVKLLIQEASPGTGAPVGKNSVGHTALALTKTASDGTSITQVVGFYPSDHSLTSSAGEIHDNTSLDFDLSATFNLDAAGFRNIINYISGQTPMYNLFDFNCTSFAYNACLTGGINLPSPSAVYSFPMTQGAMGQPATTVVEIQADVPGALGERLIQQGGNNINSNGGVGPVSKGPCYL